MILKPGKETVLAISDLQCPFQHKDAAEFLRWVRDKYNPTKVVVIGDEADFHGLSRYFKDPDGRSAGDEVKLLVKALQPFYALFPEAMVCASNHTNRPYDRAFEAGIPRSFIKDIKDVLQAPTGWHWDNKWIIDGVAYMHGHEGISGGATAAFNAAKLQPRSVVFGHLHSSASIAYYANSEELKFGFNIGCLIDVNAYAFKYGLKFVSKPVLGCGVIRKGVPVFIPMLLDSKGRWLGMKSKCQQTSKSFICTFCGGKQAARNGWQPLVDGSGYYRMCCANRACRKPVPRDITLPKE